MRCVPCALRTYTCIPNPGCDGCRRYLDGTHLYIGYGDAQALFQIGYQFLSFLGLNEFDAVVLHQLGVFDLQRAL